AGHQRRRSGQRAAGPLELKFETVVPIVSPGYMDVPRRHSGGEQQKVTPFCELARGSWQDARCRDLLKSPDETHLIGVAARMLTRSTLFATRLAALRLACAITTGAVAGERQEARLLTSTQVLSELMQMPEQNIPTWLMERAYAVAVIPS